MSEHILWYDKPANCFEEALAIGNGSLGGMIYGGFTNEKIGLNHDTLWSGGPSESKPKNYKGAIDEIRALMAEDNRSEAANVVWSRIMTDFTACYSLAGDFHIDFEHNENVFEYKRELDIENAISKTSYSIDGIKYTREYFCSNPDNALFVRLTANKPVLSGKAYFENPHKHTVEAIDNKLFVTSKMPYLIIIPDHDSENLPAGCYYDDNKVSISYCMGVSANTKNGKLIIKENEIVFTNCEEIYFKINISTDYTDYKTNPHGNLDLLKNSCDKHFLTLDEISYVEAKKRHTSDYFALYSRCELDLPSDRYNTLPTDQRLIKNFNKKDDFGIYELLFNFGRYLIISSSREGTTPANLQGIWNKDMMAAWSSGYTININLQMNYWLCELTGLSECHKPLLDFVTDLSSHGEKDARTYNCRGWCAHHNSDIWCYSGMVGGNWPTSMPSVEYAAWTMGGAWLTYHIWEHYLFTLDKEFLKEKISVIKGNALFQYDFLTENNEGYLVPSFDTTPENAYFFNGKRVAIAQGTAISIGIINASFDMYLSACKILGIKDSFCDDLIKAKTRLLPFGTDENGKLLEWDRAFESCEPTHVHMAPFWSFYPANVITKSKNPELINAIELLFEERGTEGPGHSACWKSCINSRLKNGERALYFIDKFTRLATVDEPRALGCGSYANMFACHPPFQMDGNFGVTAAIVEMLLQSHDGYIELLPALPKKWKKGSVKGLVSRFGVIVNIDWEKGKLINAKLKAQSDTNIKILILPNQKIKHNDKYISKTGIVTIDVKKGDICSIFE